MFTRLNNSYFKRTTMKHVPIILTLFIFGCATADTTMFTSETYAPTTEVKVCTDASAITEPYFEIGMVEGKGGLGASKQQCLDHMIEEAKAVGADALIKIDFGDQAQYDPSMGSYQTPVARAVMIRYKSHKS